MQPGRKRAVSLQNWDILGKDSLTVTVICLFRYYLTSIDIWARVNCILAFKRRQPDEFHVSRSLPHSLFVVGLTAGTLEARRLIGTTGWDTLAHVRANNRIHYVNMCKRRHAGTFRFHNHRGK